MKYSEKFKRIGLIMLLPMISYGVLGPLEIYFGNQHEFAFQYTDFIGMFAVLCIVTWLSASTVIAAMPEKVGNVIGGLALGIGAASYIQNMFMNVKLSEVDGSPMRWEELGSFPAINLVVWIVIIAAVLCVLFKSGGGKSWDSISFALASFLSVIQLVAVAYMFITAPPAEKKEASLCISGVEQFTVSPNDNIIVFVLDSTGNTAWENALELFPDASDVLRDFVFYNNADCHYSSTFPSMVHFLTGEDFEFSGKSQDWLAKAWNSERSISFWNELEQGNYTCYLFSNDNFGDNANLVDKFDNIYLIEMEVNKLSLARLLTEMSVYKHAPYILKPYFETLTQEFNNIIGYTDKVTVSGVNGWFYQKLVKKKLSVNYEMENAFILHHLVGMHKPYVTNADGYLVEESTAEENMKSLFVILDEYFQQLRNLGLYDDATIIVTADHGSWNEGDRQPIFLIKRSNETHNELQINTAPISLDDFQATILDILGKDYSQYGSSIYDWSEGSYRERTVYMNVNDSDYPDVTGASFNVYYGYHYSTDKEELNRKVAGGPEEVMPATSW